MTNALRTPDDYELFIYSLTEQFPIVQRSTVRFIRLGTANLPLHFVQSRDKLCSGWLAWLTVPSICA